MRRGPRHRTAKEGNTLPWGGAKKSHYKGGPHIDVAGAEMAAKG